MDKTRAEQINEIFVSALTAEDVRERAQKSQMKTSGKRQAIR